MLEHIVTFDLETTGLHARNSRIIELAAIRWFRGSVVAAFHTLVNPQCPIPAESHAVHGISDEEVAVAPDVRFALEAFEVFRGDLPLAAHNAPFDLGFLNAESARAGVMLRPARVLDTLRFSRVAFPEQPSHKLERLAAALSLDAPGFHRASADAITAGRLLWRGVDVLPEIPERAWVDWAAPVPAAAVPRPALLATA